MKKFVLIILLLCIFEGLSYAQGTVSEAENPISISVDLMSRYIWRGMDFGGSPSIQPGIEYNSGSFTLGAWGAFTTNLAGAQEVDLYISYALNDMFSLTFTDYFFPDETDATYKYFDYNDKTTGHVFEASLSFNGTDDLPLTFLIATNFHGADARRMNTDGSIGKIQYSTYAELGYSFNNLDAFIGFNLTNPDEDLDETGFYGDSFGVTNLGISTSKDIKITDDFSLPLTVSLITNPQAQKIFMVAGFSF